jgi:hypothetical protein
MWKRCPEGAVFNLSNSFCSAGLDFHRYNFQSAFIQIKAANELVNTDGSVGFAGHTNWRMPNVKEMFSIIENCGGSSSGVHNGQVFLGGGHYAPSFWTSTPSMYSSSANWIFRQNELEQNIFGNPMSLLLVRDLGN